MALLTISRTHKSIEDLILLFDEDVDRGIKLSRITDFENNPEISYVYYERYLGEPLLRRLQYGVEGALNEIIIEWSIRDILKEVM